MGESKGTGEPQRRHKAPVPAIVLASVSALAGAVVFWGVLRCGWVYDDQYQILRNRTIQQEGRLARAVMSDVWAFCARPGVAGSNYWRPTFVAFLTMEHRWFGLSGATGWHAANLVLHVLCTVLSFAFVRALGMPTVLAGAAALLFAVHPAHVESVAWISASPDLLMTAGLLSSLLLIVWALREGRWRGAKIAAAAGAYVLAMGSKESAVLFPVLVVVVVGQLTQGPGGPRTRLRRGVLWSLPFWGVAGAYLAARLLVLHGMMRTSGDLSPAGMMMTFPITACWYLRQSLFPYPLAPIYTIPLQTPERFSWTELAAPLGACVLAGAMGLYACRTRPQAERWRETAARVGVCVFVLFLLPAMNIMAYATEQPVHDRYLYLPVLGMLLVIVPLGQEALAVLTRRGGWSAWAAYGLSVIVSVPLAMESVSSCREWACDLTLWSWGVRTLPENPLNQRLLGIFLLDAGRPEEALAAFDASLKVARTSTAVLGRTEALMDLGRYAEAQRVLERIIALPDDVASGTLSRSYERLAVCYDRLGRDPEPLLRSGIARLSDARCALTEKLAVVLYQKGRKAEALAALEDVLPEARASRFSGEQMVYYRLGLLYQEQGRTAEARGMFLEYMAASEGMENKQTRAARAETQRRLRQLD
jgi:tetratricopeptide (TPR) repeat protein